MKKLIFYPFYAYAMKIYHKDKDYDKAREFYEKAAQWNPNYAENLFKIGMCYKKQRKYQQASKYFEKALELNLNNTKYQEQLQIVSDKYQQYSLFAPTKIWWQEIIALESQIQQEGESFGLLVRLAEDCLAMKHYQKAANAYEKAIKLCPQKEKSVELYYEMGYAYENLADEVSLKSAEISYKKAIELDEKLESKRYGIGVFHFAKERWKFANRAFLQTLHSCEASTASLRGEAEASVAKATDPHLQTHSLADQNANYSVIARATPEATYNVSDQKIRNGEIQGYRLPRDSSESLAMTENQNPSNDKVGSLQKSDIIDCHDSLRNLAMTETLAHPKSSDDLLLKKIGESFERLYDWQNAIKYYQESLNLNYQNPQTHFRLGFAQERMGDLKGAVESYTQGLNRNNDLNTYWVYRLGFCLSMLQDFEGAAQALLNLQTTNAYPLLVGGGGDPAWLDSSGSCLA